MLAGLDGHAPAQAALLRNIASLMRSFFSRRLADRPEDVEDLVQETLIAVHTRRSSYDRRRAFAPWLFSIARHKLADHFRRRYRIPLTETLDETLRSENFESSSQARMDVDRLLSRLPAKQARSIRAIKLDGLTVAEAAAGAGLSASDVKISVHRGMKRLSDAVDVARYA
jgi:RNA polymerase sigma-70 factor (ECF subfamily)